MENIQHETLLDISKLDINDTTVIKRSSSNSLSSKISKAKKRLSQKKDNYNIHKAAQKGKIDVIRDILKKKKSLVNATNESGHTPIHLASLHGHLDVVSLLIENGSDLLIKDNSGWSVLHFAASGRNEDIIKLLLEQPSIDVNAENEGLNTPLHYLARNFSSISKSTIETFIKRGANINAQNVRGETPLHGAALKNHHIVIERLIECGADVDIVNHDGETPLNWATNANNEASISVLLKAHSTNFRHKKSIVEKPSFLQTPVSKFEPHIRYELTFIGKDTEVILNDDNWDTCLYEGGLRLENKSSSLIENPHYDAIRKEELPLSKLFNLYLFISGRNKTDPEIVYWIVDFLTGPKRAYLLHLCENYSYRISVKSTLNEKKNETKKLSRYESVKEKYLEIWEEPSDNDIILWKSVFECGDNYLDDLRGSNEMKKRIKWLVEQKRNGKLSWEIEPKDINIICKIGNGTYGTVYKGKWMGVEVAVKTVDTTSMDIYDYHSFLNEIIMMSNLRHPNIVMFLGGCIKPPNLFFVTEFLILGSLDNVLKLYPKLDWKVRLNIAIEVARGLSYLHNQNPPILHRDLKSLNVLVDKNFHVRVADFGFSTDKSSNLNSKVGTLNWIAPEFINGSASVYTESADIYSLGMILWEIVSGRVPYEGKSQLQILRMVDMHETEIIPKGTNYLYAQLITDCWNTDPSKRPTIGEVLEKLELIKRIEFSSN